MDTYTNQLLHDIMYTVPQLSIMFKAQEHTVMIKSATMIEVNHNNSGINTLSASTSELRVKKMMSTERVAATLVKQRIWHVSSVSSTPGRSLHLLR